jgi:hypothetical protein
MKKIDCAPKTNRELFTGLKYTIHYYQREYQWLERQDLYEELAKKIWGITRLDEQLN